MFGWLKGESKPKPDPSKFHKPEYYRGSDGPEFKVLESKPDDYEVRLYANSVWVGASATQPRDYGNVTSSLFWKLFNYIRGNNEQEKKIDMTVPVRTQVVMAEDGESKSVTMAFFIPTPLHADPPQPKDTEVFHVKEPRTVMYARNFGGFANDKSWQEQLNLLKASLDRDGKGYVTDGYIGVGYDPPFRLFGRRNEVFLAANPQPKLEEQEKADGEGEEAQEAMI